MERGAPRVVPCSSAEEGSGNGSPQSGNPLVLSEDICGVSEIVASALGV